MDLQINDVEQIVQKQFYLYLEIVCGWGGIVNQFVDYGLFNTLIWNSDLNRKIDKLDLYSILFIKKIILVELYFKI